MCLFNVRVDVNSHTTHAAVPSNAMAQTQSAYSMCVSADMALDSVSKPLFARNFVCFCRMEVRIAEKVTREPSLSPSSSSLTPPTKDEDENEKKRPSQTKACGDANGRHQLPSNQNEILKVSSKLIAHINFSLNALHTETHTHAPVFPFAFVYVRNV